jgi:hypothetical protein
MKARQVMIALIGSFLPATLFASANVAQAPQALRQTYDDGSATELACNTQSSPPLCTFKVFVGSDTRRFQIDHALHAFQFHVGEYWFWPGPTLDEFTIAIPVVCSEQDSALLKRSHREYAECRVFLESQHGKLWPRRVQVSSVLAPHVQRERVLAGP